MTREPVQPAAIRRKVESWLAEEDDQMAIALRTRAEWQGDPMLAVGDHLVRIIACPTPLAMRAALYDRQSSERLVLLTELGDAELGDGLLAHLSRCTVRSVDAWDLVRQMFRTAALDPTISNAKYGGGRWIADALTDFAPAEGWPPLTGTVLTREPATLLASPRPSMPLLAKEREDWTSSPLT